MGKINKEKFFLIIGWALTLFSVIILCQQGLTRSYFHQDDVIELGTVAAWSGWSTVVLATGEHLIMTFWALLRLQWVLFGINFTPYLLINNFMHISVLSLLFIITFRKTKSLLWASIPVWGMVINANWFSVVWWITGQMVMISTIFALLSYWVILKIIDNPKSRYLYPLLFLFSVLPGLSWGLGLTWPIWPILIYGINYTKKCINRIGITLIASQAFLTVTYFSLIGSEINVHTNSTTWLTKPFEILKFAIVGVSNTLIGRWLWPLENLKTRVVILFILLMVILISKTYKKVLNKDILFGLIVVVGCFITFAIPRWTFGIGHAMTNYFAYFPQAFLLISVSILFSKLKLKGLKKVLVLSIFIIQIPFSWLGLESWAKDWVQRPQQTRTYFQILNSVKPNECIDNIYIPEYIVPQNIWRIDYLWPIFNKDFDPFCNKEI